jgi:sugar lactone lactonase YvrE
MKSESGRYAVAGAPRLADGWQLQRLTPPSRLFGANGLRTGPDGRIYVAQVSGSQISAVDVDTGAVETVSAQGGDIVAPDDLVFDPQGNLYATEITEGRVCVRAPNGLTRVVYGDLPCANPITFHQGRLFAGECRVGGRILELDLDGGAPRVLLENVPMPNAMEVGPDGMLYFPVMGTNEIWRVGLDGGAAQTVAADLGVPDAVKFDATGQIVSTQVATGQVLRIDPRSGARTVLADIAPGLDNLTFVGDRLFVSSISGQINEIVSPGKIRSLLPDGFNWPLDLAMGDDGVLFIADGPYCYSLQPGGVPQVAGMLFTPGCPGYIRGVVATGRGEVIVTTANGVVARYQPTSQQHEVLASGFDQLYGVAQASGGAVIVAELGAGRVLSVAAGKVEELACDLHQPLGVAIDAQGTCFISESGAGRVVKVRRGAVETVLDGLQKPQGILAVGDLLYVVDTGAKELLEYNVATRVRRTIAGGLPVGAPAGVVPKFLGAIGDMSGPMGPFAGITAGTDGTLYLSADADGSILALSPVGTGN